MGCCSGLTSAIKKVVKAPVTLVKKSVDVVRDTVSGDLDIKGAATMALLSPVVAVNTHPREALLAGGAVAAGAYVAGATTAAAAPVAAAPAATGTVLATTGTAVAVKVAEQSISDKALEFVVDSAMQNQIAKNANDFNEPINYDTPSGQQMPNFSGASNQTAMLLAGGLALLVVGSIIAKR